MKIGVLALQGDFAEHQSILEKIGVEVIQVRLAEQLQGLNGLIIPGGESTTIGKLAVDFGLMKPLREFSRQHAIWGTCAGAIFIAKDIHRPQPLLGIMDITVARNAFGRQIDSFEIDLNAPFLPKTDHTDGPFHAVFIRAPLIESVQGSASVLVSLPQNGSKHSGQIVAAQQGKMLATSFHPELTRDDRFHRYFLELSK